MPKRGDVWWVRLDPTQGSEIAKTRPCVVMSSDVINRRRRTVVVIPLSSSPNAHPPLLVGVVVAGRNVVAVVDQIRAVSKDRLAERMGALQPQEILDLEGAVREVLEIG